VTKFLKFIIKNVSLPRSGNLVALDDPYTAIKELLKFKSVTGIVDAGASNGRVASKLLRCCPSARVFAFEPNPMYAGDLKERAAEDSRISPQHFALSNRAGKVRLNVTESPGMTSLFAVSEQLQKAYPKETAVKEALEVECITIDEWVKANGNPRIELMKLDIQGGELLALKGAVEELKRSTLLIYSEIFFNPLYQGGALYSEIDLFLREQGFSLFNIYKPRSNRNDMLVQANAIFIKTREFGF